MTSGNPQYGHKAAGCGAWAGGPTRNEPQRMRDVCWVAGSHRQRSRACKGPWWSRLSI